MRGNWFTEPRSTVSRVRTPPTELLFFGRIIKQPRAVSGGDFFSLGRGEVMQRGRGRKINGERISSFLLLKMRQGSWVYLRCKDGSIYTRWMQKSKLRELRPTPRRPPAAN